MGVCPGSTFTPQSPKNCRYKRQVWDGTTKILPTDMVMNDHTPTEVEAEIDFGTAKYEFYLLIYNMRVSYPGASTLFSTC